MILWLVISHKHGVCEDRTYNKDSFLMGNVNDQLGKINVYYDELPDYVPRAVLVDLDPCPLDC